MNRGPTYHRIEKDRPIYFVDTETTGIKGGRLIDLAVLGEDWEEPRVMRVKPLGTIDFEAMSVHHITPAMLINEPTLHEHPDYMEFREYVEEGQLVAHRADFDMGVLRREGFRVNIEDAICTKKLTMRLHPDFTNTHLQYLRYALEANVLDAAPHTARGDVLVLRSVFNKLIGEVMADQKKSREEAIKAVLRMQGEPFLLTYIPDRFKKHAGKPFVHVNRIDREYIEWMYREIPNMGNDQELIHTVTHYFKRRSV